MSNWKYMLRDMQSLTYIPSHMLDECVELLAKMDGKGLKPCLKDGKWFVDDETLQEELTFFMGQMKRNIELNGNYAATGEVR